MKRLHMLRSATAVALCLFAFTSIPSASQAAVRKSAPIKFGSSYSYGLGIGSAVGTGESTFTFGIIFGDPSQSIANSPSSIDAYASANPDDVVRFLYDVSTDASNNQVITFLRDTSYSSGNNLTLPSPLPSAPATPFDVFVNGQQSRGTGYFFWDFESSSLPDATAHIDFKQAGDPSNPDSTNFGFGPNDLKFDVSIQGSSTSTVPEPSSLAMLACGVGGLFVLALAKARRRAGRGVS